jgi:hypothetical protein
MNAKVNESFNDKGEKARFIYKPNPLTRHAYQIFEFKNDKNSYEPVGEYTVIDFSEEVEITEKKVINLIMLMNGKRDLLELGNLTQSRLLYTMVPSGSEAQEDKIIFRTFDGKGVSKENAVLTIEKGVFHESGSSP